MGEGCAMTASQLIAELQRRIALHGDLPVVNNNNEPIKSVSPFHDDDNSKHTDDCKNDCALVIS
jgi:hypothetical protein